MTPNFPIGTIVHWEFKLKATGIVIDTLAYNYREVYWFATKSKTNVSLYRLRKIL